MNKAQQDREVIITALAELKSDTEHIKEGVARNEKQLNQINGRVRKTEEKVKFIEGVGSVLSVIFTFTIGWLFRR
jgi:predicted  nucleic acid-binding Zn-ribbon protein|tara:strand:- start:621 stop:845 length:225 start_codon:yes stop_codon:yes gene_type:complete